MTRMKSNIWVVDGKWWSTKDLSHHLGISRQCLLKRLQAGADTMESLRSMPKQKHITAPVASSGQPSDMPGRLERYAIARGRRQCLRG